jgi:hypothetical protein
VVLHKRQRCRRSQEAKGRKRRGLAVEAKCCVAGIYWRSGRKIHVAWHKNIYKCLMQGSILRVREPYTRTFQCHRHVRVALDPRCLNVHRISCRVFCHQLLVEDGSFLSNMLHEARGERETKRNIRHKTSAAHCHHNHSHTRKEKSFVRKIFFFF